MKKTLKERAKELGISTEDFWHQQSGAETEIKTCYQKGETEKKTLQGYEG